MAKEIDKLFSISKVAEEIGVKSYVIRFWEQNFLQLKPVVGKGGRRYYDRENIDLLIKIKDLIHNQGYKIKAARKILSQNTTKSSITNIYSHDNLVNDAEDLFSEEKDENQYDLFDTLLNKDNEVKDSKLDVINEIYRDNLKYEEIISELFSIKEKINKLL